MDISYYIATKDIKDIEVQKGDVFYYCKDNILSNKQIQFQYDNKEPYFLDFIRIDSAHFFEFLEMVSDNNNIVEYNGEDYYLHKIYIKGNGRKFLILKDYDEIEVDVSDIRLRNFDIDIDNEFIPDEIFNTVIPVYDDYNLAEIIYRRLCYLTESENMLNFANDIKYFMVDSYGEIHALYEGDNVLNTLQTKLTLDEFFKIDKKPKPPELTIGVEYIQFYKDYIQVVGNKIDKNLILDLNKLLNSYPNSDVDVLNVGFDGFMLPIDHIKEIYNYYNKIEEFES